MDVLSEYSAGKATLEEKYQSDRENERWPYKSEGWDKVHFLPRQFESAQEKASAPEGALAQSVEFIIGLGMQKGSYSFNLESGLIRENHSPNSSSFCKRM